MESEDTSGGSLGELFVERGLISEADLELARVEEAATKRRLTDILVRRGLVTGRDITSALMEQLNRFGARPRTAQPESPEPVEPADAAPEDKPDVVLSANESPEEATAARLPVDELWLRLAAETAGTDLEPAPGTTEPEAGGAASAEPESTSLAAEHGPLPQTETFVDDWFPPQKLIREADIRRRAAEAELAALGHVWQGLQQVQTELETHKLSSPTLTYELDATQARLRTRENELSAEITLWEGAREEAGRAADELDQLRRELSEKVHELSETQATAATWSARVAELEAEIEEITRRATAAAHVLEVLATTRFAAPTTEEFPPSDAADEPHPPHDNGQAGVSDAGFLYFVPKDESYELVEREGSPPEVDEVVKVGELLFVVTKIGRSPLPSDARSCVFLATLQ
jgi:hypothetical protein